MCQYSVYSPRLWRKKGAKYPPRHDRCWHISRFSEVIHHSLLHRTHSKHLGMQSEHPSIFRRAMSWLMAFMTRVFGGTIRGDYIYAGKFNWVFDTWRLFQLSRVVVALKGIKRFSQNEDKKSSSSMEGGKNLQKWHNVGRLFQCTLFYNKM